MNKGEFFDLPLYFVRHKMTSNTQAYSKLISEGCVAFHYEYDLKDKTNPRTFEPEDYTKKSNQDLFKRLKRICKSGAIIAGDFSYYHPEIPSKMLMGFIEKGSDPEDTIDFMEFKVKGKRAKDYPDGIGTYKIVPLKKPKVFPYVKYRELQTLQAGRRGNLTRWRKGEEYIKNLFAAKIGIIDSIPKTVYSLTSSQLEVLCSECLRHEIVEDIQLDYLLSPIGRGRKDIDIDGMSDDKLVLSQVSMSKNNNIIEEKIENLLGYSKDAYNKDLINFVYFGPESEKDVTTSKYSYIIYVPIEEVFTKMQEIGIVDDMLKK